MSLPNYATNIAIIKDMKVENVIWGYLYDTSFLQDGESLAEVGELSVNIGDDYIDGKFFHDGEEVKTIY